MGWFAKLLILLALIFSSTSTSDAQSLDFSQRNIDEVRASAWWLFSPDAPRCLLACSICRFTVGIAELAFLDRSGAFDEDDDPYGSPPPPHTEALDNGLWYIYLPDCGITADPGLVAGILADLAQQCLNGGGTPAGSVVEATICP